MKHLEFQGVVYRSIRDACHKLKISYPRVMRLRRHYQRAADDVSVALSWGLQPYQEIPPDEPQTAYRREDRRNNSKRQRRIRQTRREKIYKLF